jgi:SAM-dependent methyltransferase
MGAKVTGLDFSEVAIENAQQINKELGLDAQFVCSDVCDLPQELYNQFDIVFTSYGTIGWFPDLASWAKTINKALLPGGKFIMVDFHPFIWAFDNDLKYLQYDYFKSEPIEEEIEGSYADRNAPIKTKTISWNHGIGEILNTLIQSGISIHEFTEMDYSPFDCFSNLKKIEDDKFVFSHIEPAIPMIYRIVGVRN